MRRIAVSDKSGYKPPPEVIEKLAVGLIGMLMSNLPLRDVKSLLMRGAKQSLGTVDKDVECAAHYLLSAGAEIGIGAHDLDSEYNVKQKSPEPESRLVRR